MKKGKGSPFAPLERDVDPQLRKLTFVRARCVLLPRSSPHRPSAARECLGNEREQESSRPNPSVFLSVFSTAASLLPPPRKKKNACMRPAPVHFFGRLMREKDVHPTDDATRVRCRRIPAPHTSLTRRTIATQTTNAGGLIPRSSPRRQWRR